MAGTTGLLVVHGIGAQERGETLDKLVRGLHTVDRDFAPGEQHDGSAATLGGQPLRLYEVYWADILKGKVTQGAFLMPELLSLAWFPFFNVRRGNYRAGSYSFMKLAWWCVTLPMVNFLVLFAYYGAGAVAQIFIGLRGKQYRSADQGDMSRIAQKFVGHGTTRTCVDDVLDEYAGDVFSYVNSARHAFYRKKEEPPVPPEVQEAFQNIVQRFDDQLLRAHADGCDTIQVVSHSLGTVVMYHALSGFGFDPRRKDADSIRAARAKVSHVYTIGSPLEKIRFFWPRIAPLGMSPSGMTLRWDNFVSFFDPVAGILKSFRDWGTVHNHRLLGGGFIRGHVVYEHSSVFLDALSEGLCGRRISSTRGLAKQLRDSLVLLGETVFAPTSLAIVLACGAGLFGLAAGIIPFLISRVGRWFVPLETWAPVADKAWFALLALMTLAALIASAARANEVHSRYWTGMEAGTPLRQDE